MKPTRERLLDAFESILVAEGERAATLDAVAAAAGTSKGGLIYHFPSKEALVDGLCDRFLIQVAADIAAMRTASDGAARYYVRTSAFAGTPLDLSLLALARLQDAQYPQASDAARQAGESWLAELVTAIGDPVKARVIKLIGDGLYYEALVSEKAEPASHPVTIDDLLNAVDTIATSPAI